MPAIRDEMAMLLGEPAPQHPVTGNDRGKTKRATPLPMAFIESMARAGVSTARMAAVCGLSERAFSARMKRNVRLANSIHNWRLAGEAALQVAIHMKAVHDGNVDMMKWASRNRLGWTEKNETPAAAAITFLVETRPKIENASEWEDKFAPRTIEGEAQEVE